MPFNRKIGACQYQITIRPQILFNYHIFILIIVYTEQFALLIPIRFQISVFSDRKSPPAENTRLKTDKSRLILAGRLKIAPA